MALEGLYIRVTHTGTTTGAILLSDVDAGFERESANRVYRPGPVYVPAGGSVDLVYSSTVAHSYESGGIRQLVDAGKLSVTLLRGSTVVLSWLYDFAELGGAVGAITLKNVNNEAYQLPSGLVAVRGWIETVTAVTSGGATTIEVGVTADPDGFRVSTAKAAFSANSVLPFNGAFVHNGTDTATAVAKRFTAATNVTATVGTAAITAGKFYVHIECIASLG